MPTAFTIRDEPVLGQAELFAEIAVGTEGALELGLVGFGHLVDVLLGHAEFFGADHRKQRPFHDVEPLIVAMAHHRAERLLRDHFGQHDVVGRVGELQALGVELETSVVKTSQRPDSYALTVSSAVANAITSYFMLLPLK